MWSRRSEEREAWEEARRRGKTMAVLPSCRVCGSPHHGSGACPKRLIEDLEPGPVIGWWEFLRDWFLALVLVGGILVVISFLDKVI